VSERYYAEMEAARNEALDAYFAARPQLMRTPDEERIFRAGFERAFESLWKEPTYEEIRVGLSSAVAILKGMIDRQVNTPRDIKWARYIHSDLMAAERLKTKPSA
jgi:hypothetical protein